MPDKVKATVSKSVQTYDKAGNKVGKPSVSKPKEMKTTPITAAQFRKGGSVKSKKK